MAWESDGSRGEEEKPGPREIFLARKERGRGRSWVRNRRGTRERLAERREKPPDSGRRGQGRNGRVDSAGERGRAAPAGGGSDPESRAAGIPGQGIAGAVRPGALGPDVGSGPHLEQGRAAAAAAAQVAEPGGGGASSPSPGRRRRWRGGGWGGEVALKGTGATGVGTSARVGLSRRIR